MKGSLKLGAPFGIGLYVHWTFALLIGFLLISGFGIAGVVFALAIFACVTLHEYGHALAARHYHIHTDSVTLYPIGGVARLASMPRDPKQELVIALAGPAVNVAIAALLAPVVLLLNVGFGSLSPAAPDGFLAQLLVVNLSLVVFNLIPAFPMDGGRVFRALLAMRRDFVSATDIAARTGQAIAFLFGLYGLFIGNLFLVAIAVFIYMSAGAERRMAALLAQFGTPSPPPIPTGDPNWEVLPPEPSPSSDHTSSARTSHARPPVDAQQAIIDAIRRGFPQSPPPFGRRP